MILDENSSFRTITKEDFGKNSEDITDEDIQRFSNERFWPLSRQYQKNDVLITCEALHSLDKLYRAHIGVSVVDTMGLPSASFN